MSSPIRFSSSPIREDPSSSPPRSNNNNNNNARNNVQSPDLLSDIFINNSARRTLPRSDVRSDVRGRLFSDSRNKLTSSVIDHLTTTASSKLSSEVWGTTISIHETTKKFTLFIKDFALDSTSEPKYISELQELAESGECMLDIDCADLYSYDVGLYNQLVRYPSDVISIMDVTINEIFENLFPEHARSGMLRIQVRTFNLREVKHMRDLNPADIDQMVSIRGMITRCSPIIPEIKIGFFKCSLCQYTLNVNVERGRIEEPTRCPNCGEQRSMELIHNRCLFTDKQIVKLQETPEAIPEGETPHTVNLCCFDSLVDSVKPGDRVDITGVYKAVPIRFNPRQRTIKAIFKNYIDVIHFKKSNTHRMNSEDDSNDFIPTVDEDFIVKITEQEENKLKELAKSPDIYEKLTRAIAPNIWEMDDVKKGILCQLFGGTNKDIPNGKIRGEINVLLVGDPGVSKSQLLQYVHKIAPRGIYTSGKGSSAVGLTAYITKDPETRELVLESGALVLSDRGICCIDEFDKMSDSTRSILHEVMEQQTVSIAKAGIIATLNARTSILAAANPVESKYNENMTIVENIQLPPTLLSRFDLIYVLKDRANATLDRRLAKHIISLYYENPEDRDQEIDIRTLTQYIAYAKRNIHPILNDEAAEHIVKCYCDLRRMGASKEIITATTRQLESMIRLSEALARMRFSSEVTVDDVAEANRLIRVAIYKAALDPKSGKVDIDLLNTGHTFAEREEMQRHGEDGDAMADFGGSQSMEI